MSNILEGKTTLITGTSRRLGRHLCKLFAILLCTIYTLVLPNISFAGDITLRASVDRKVVPLGGSVQLTLTLSGTQRVPRQEIEIEGFQVSYLGPSTQVSIVNGKVSSSVSHIYSLVPIKIGKFTLGPFSVQYKGKTYETQPITMEVVEDQRRGRQEGGEKETIQLSDRIFLTMSIGKKEAYLNEELPLTIRLYVKDLAVHDIQYPTFPSDKFLVGNFLDPTQGQRTVDGVLFDVIEFKRFISPIATGELTLGPAEIKCNLLVRTRRRRRPGSLFDDFFSETTKRPLAVKSEPLILTVKPFPSEGKPQDFAGAVGNYDLGVSVNPTEVKVGEPITLTAVVKGRGNFDTVSAPIVSSLEGFKVYEPQIKKDTSLGSKGTVGEKTFEQVVIPGDQSISEIPVVSFSFFNPKSGRYESIAKGPIPIKVLKPAGEGKAQIVELPAQVKTIRKEVLGRDIVYIKDSLSSSGKSGSYLYENKIFLGAGLLPLVALIGASLYRRRKDRLSEDLGYARLQRAPGKARKGIAEAKKLAREGKAEEFYNTVFKTMREYLGDRFNIPSGGITPQIVDDLEMKGVSRDILEPLSSFFQSCDSARFAPGSINLKDMKETLELMGQVIGKFEKSKIS